jgi:ABC-2 type transport system ATP-binding protein
MDLIYTKELTKKFKDLQAVDHLNWSVPEGSLCAFLGPNGAGKTTTLKMLLDIAHPTSGSASILGLDSQTQSLEIRRAVAFVSEDKTLYDSMTLATVIRFYSSFYPDWSESAMDELLKAWNLPVDQKIRELSKGMRTKFYLALSLARKPRVLILDEPTEGLDPVSQEEVLKLLTHWLTHGQRSAVIASHRLEEVERIADRVTIINQGKLLLNHDLDELRSNWKTIEFMGDFSSTSNVVQITKSGMVSRIVTSKYPEFQEELKKQHLSPLHVYDMNLRDIYLAALRQGGLNYDSLENVV